MSRAYAAHAELCAAIHAHDDAEMLHDMAGEMPELLAYPISGDMLAVVQRATPYDRRARRKRAATERTAR
ncbi:hypothetical protein [Leucobacter chironomi]|uniref:hypothetical protein n=1 Tax=Leucobacter chironomi TaxID=491918 RepID=UPI0003F9F8C0|nr:hypothetical protein [Leucobacter chironomi]